MTSPIPSEIKSGPTFEIFEGPRSLQRLDWTADGALRTTHVGYAEKWCAERIILRMDAFSRAKKPITLCHDFSDATGYEPEVRILLQGWAKDHPGAQTGIHVYTRSKLVQMAVSVATLVLGDLMKGYAKRQDFDLALKKCGLPVNIELPTFVPKAD